MPLVRLPEPFDHPDWLFEVKYDGFRALAHITGHQCELRSRNGHTFKQWSQLCEELAHLLFRRDWPYFYAFDLLAVDGEDLRGWPLIERKRRLRRLIPLVPTRLLYVDHVQGRASDFFRVACAHDLEGIVAKAANGRYHADARARTGSRSRILATRR